jgi:hypothetical protein
MLIVLAVNILGPSIEERSPDPLTPNPLLGVPGYVVSNSYDSLTIKAAVGLPALFSIVYLMRSTFSLMMPMRLCASI